MVVAPPFPGHRSDAGDEESAAADMGGERELRCQRFRALLLDSFGVKDLRDLAKLPGISGEHEEAYNDGEKAAMAAAELGLGFARAGEREKAREEKRR